MTDKKKKRRASQKRNPQAEVVEMFRVMKALAVASGQDVFAQQLDAHGDSLANDAEYVAWLEKTAKTPKPFSDEAILSLGAELKTIIARLVPASEPIELAAVDSDWVPPPRAPLTCANCVTEYPDPMQFGLYEMGGKAYVVSISTATWHQGGPFGLCAACTMLLCQVVIDRQGVPLPPRDEKLIEFSDEPGVVCGGVK